MPTPGATMSGFASKSMALGPRELNAGHRVVGTGHRALVARGADRQHPGRVARRADRAVLHLTQAVLAEVARSRHDNDAGVHGALGRERQRIGLVRLGDRWRQPTG